MCVHMTHIFNDKIIIKRNAEINGWWRIFRCAMGTMPICAPIYPKYINIHTLVVLYYVCIWAVIDQENFFHFCEYSVFLLMNIIHYWTVFEWIYTKCALCIFPTNPQQTLISLKRKISKLLFLFRLR